MTWKGGNFVEKELSTYSIRSAGRCLERSSMSPRFRQGLQPRTEARSLDSGPGMSEERSNYRSLS